MANPLDTQAFDRLRWSFASAAAEGLPDTRHGSNTRYPVTGAALSAFANFFLQDPSFSSFQCRVLESAGRSNCQSLFPIDAIPKDNTIRSLLDSCPSSTFDSVFPPLPRNP